LRQIEQDKVSIVEVVPSLLRELLIWQERNPSQKPSLIHLRWLIPTGEALTSELARLWLQAYPRIPLLNAYGPTECSDDVTHQIIDRLACLEDRGVTVPIGRPLPNLRVYVLDRHMQPQPLGVHGEIYVGGVGVGRGYLDNTARTALQFVPDPWSLRGGERLYRTGDVGYYRPDGSLVFVGRVDEQVKIRGHRIELGEIEVVIREQDGVSDCAVICQETSGASRLIAYVVGQQETQLDREGLLRSIRAILPDYMIPTLVQIDALPRTTNGKLDRRALPEPGVEAEIAVTEYIAPRNSMEEQLASIWAEVLSLPRVGIHDNFFAIGGHSLLITQILSRTSDAFQITLPVRTLFKNPTIAELAEAIEKTRSRSSELRRQAVTSVSREAFRQRRSTLTEAAANNQEHLKG
jgi:acyl carrier protein